MSSFVALRKVSLLEQACRELSSQFEYTKKRNGLWLPGEILGVWVGSHASLNLSFDHSFGFLDRWVMVCLDEPYLSRATLLEELVARSNVDPCAEGPRFMPVFSRGTPGVYQNIYFDCV